MEKNVITTNRLESFSDGVISIIITIMVFNMIPNITPNADSDQVSAIVFRLLIYILIYTLSFVVLAILWINHHNMMHYVERTDTKLVWLNMHLLFWMSLIPLPTFLLTQFTFIPMVSTFYGFILFMAALALTLLRRYANGLMKEEVSNAVNRRANRKNIISTALYFSSAVAPLLNENFIYYSMLVFVAIPAMYFIPEKVVEDE